MTDLLLGGNGQHQIHINPKMCNRHGLIAGATGTGKTVTLQVMAESFSSIGVPVFLADIKGDLSGLACAGKAHAKVTERTDYIGIDQHTFEPYPTVFWDVFAKLGHPMRTTVSDIGPLLLSNLLELNETQTGIMYACFKVADDQGWLLLDFDDLRSMLNFLGENAKALQAEYGNISSASLGAIRRRLLILEEQGFERFLGEPALNLDDLMRVDFSGKGIINVMDVTQLMQNSPRLYATILLWLLSELFEKLPEVGDPKKPKLVLFFDEAHLLFDDAPDALIDKIEQVVRLIRSKGVGVFFVTQSPMDIPESVLGQLGLKVQHALRAFTPKDKKAIKIVAENFRANETFKTADVLPELGIGEALVSTLDEDGSPTPVERTLICPPHSRIGPASAKERAEYIDRSPYKGKYDEIINRESAHELLMARAEIMAAEAAEEEEYATSIKPTRRRSTRQTPMEAFVKSMTRSIGSQLGRKIARGILGSIFKK